MNTNKEQYTPPLCEVIALETTIGMMAMSGRALDSNDSDFGAPAQRRGTWGDLWREE